MPQKLLDRSDIVTVLHQVGCEGVAEGMARGAFCQTRLGHRLFHRFLHQRGIDMMSSLLSGPGVPPPVFLGEYPLPSPIREAW